MDVKKASLVVVVTILVSGAFVAGQGVQSEITGVDDCKELITYPGMRTANALQFFGTYTKASCDEKCDSVFTCLSAHFLSTGQCWYGNSVQSAYGRSLWSVSLVNKEWPCRIPNLGCQYEVISQCTHGGTLTPVAPSNLYQCHEKCVNNPNCKAWYWVDSVAVTNPSTRCQHVIGEELVVNSAPSGHFCFKMLCREPTTTTTTTTTTSTTTTTTTTAAPIVSECGFRKVPGVASTGTLGIQLSPATLRLCWDLCLIDFTCASFEFSGTTCTTYTTVDPTTPATGTDFYELICPCSTTTTTTTTAVFPTIREIRPGFPGPTALPSGYQAYPGKSIRGGVPHLGQTAETCLDLCDNTVHPDYGQCFAYDYNAPFRSCFLHFRSSAKDTACDAFTKNDDVYHVKLPWVKCGAGYPPPDLIVQ